MVAVASPSWRTPSAVKTMTPAQSTLAPAETGPSVVTMGVVTETVAPAVTVVTMVYVVAP